MRNFVQVPGSVFGLRVKLPKGKISPKVIRAFSYLVLLTLTYSDRTFWIFGIYIKCSTRDLVGSKIKLKS